MTLKNKAAPGIGNGDGAFYAALITGSSWPAWQNAAGTTAFMNALPSSIANGYVSLPGGLLLQWGTVTVNTNPITVNFNTGFTLLGVASNAFSVVITPKTPTISNNSAFSVTSIGGSSFSIIVSLGNPLPSDFCWYAIGTKT